MTSLQAKFRLFFVLQEPHRAFASDSFTVPGVTPRTFAYRLTRSDMICIQAVTDRPRTLQGIACRSGSKEIVERIRRECPVGSRVELLRMFFMKMLLSLIIETHLAECSPNAGACWCH